ncbi:MAG: polysaccharide biosynthesis C-terminal domain-containing protein, partial [Oscillospiraceae bacterium]
LMLVFPSCVGLFALSYEVTMLYGTAKYISAYPVMQVFAIRFMISCLKIIYTDQIMFVYKKEKEISKLLITGGIINLAFKVFLIITKSLSPITAIFTTMISEIVVLVMLHLYTKKVLKVKFSILQFKNIKYLYISLTFIPIVYVIKYFNLGILLTCFISVTICALYYLVFLIATKDDILKYYFDKFTNKLFKNNKLKK